MARWAWLPAPSLRLGRSSATSRPQYIQNWREGAEGERKTAKALKPLKRSGLRVLHDVQRRYGNYDHIAIARAGVFLLETKNLKGSVEVRTGSRTYTGGSIRTSMNVSSG